jgi:hypothetical protein
MFAQVSKLAGLIMDPTEAQKHTTHLVVVIMSISLSPIYTGGAPE